MRERILALKKGWVITVPALVVIAWQLSTAQKTSDLQALEKFYSDISERERALDQICDKKKEWALIEFLNCIEIYCAAYNNGLFQKVSKEVVRSKLRDVVAVINNSPQIFPLFKKITTSHDTFKELQKFSSNQKEGIRSAKNMQNL